MSEEKIELGKNWFIERPDKKTVWYLVDKRDSGKAIPMVNLKVPKDKDKGKILKQILEINHLLAEQSDIVHDVFPPPWAV